MIRVEGLKKSYGPIQALRDVSFQVAAGEIVGLLGPNGAGKSTIIKILTGYLQPDEGIVEVDGLDVLTHRLEVQARIGYLPESTPLYPDMSVQAYLRWIADVRAIPPDKQTEYISEAAYATDIVGFLNRPIGTLSKGMRQRVGLAQAILHKPRLLILDEPTIGLDPTQLIEIRQLIRRLAERSTVLFSSHILPEVEAVCHRAIIIMNGQIKADARLSELAATNNALLTLQRPVENFEAALKQVRGVKRVERLPDGGATYRVYGEPQVDLCPALYAAAVHAGWPIRELRADTRTLENVFNELAKGESQPQPVQ
ncbi:MAG: ABC transporter ATP-binding protein [Thermoflexales bacterium]|nr:ABC transporter ATP-binding protein [Thermoflexales bacterium]